MYNVIKKNNKFCVFGKNEGGIIFETTSANTANQICNNLNNGGAFEGSVPGFFFR